MFPCFSDAMEACHEQLTKADNVVADLQAQLIKAAEENNEHERTFVEQDLVR